ncbi:kinase-like domain-containing protein [Suillus placidus]|uniref:Kinase-like domain-containing protein n=1 Tax=Suillus placidus TaxID=48579 RepID=A0A9P7CW83_9AGAM|nr:kinase-like domain-containing protein [Suillus placidus]
MISLIQISNEAVGVTPYIPQFFWRFWLSDADPLKHTLDDHRVHAYDVYDNELSETRRVPEQVQTIFHNFDIPSLDEGCRSVLHTAEKAFTRLENEVERILSDFISKIRSSHSGESRPETRLELPISKHSRDALLRYFVFLRYRNSDKYTKKVASLTTRVITGSGAVVNARHAWHRVRRRATLGGFHAFLQHENTDKRVFRHFEGLDCWRFCDAEICIGLASEGQQFVLPDSCFATLDEEFAGDPSSAHLLFPMMPTIALYILGTQREEPRLHSLSVRDRVMGAAAAWIDVDIESPADVHLRNASLLQQHPARLYFSSLTSITQAIAHYDSFRWVPEHLDYSRLKQRARQKATLEQLTKTLVVKGSVLLVDLTDEVEKVGNAPVSGGSFADVWKGIWTNSHNGTRPVALKYLRQYMHMTDENKEKLMLVRRLKSEVVAWHRLHHSNIAQLYGVAQFPNSIAMVSPWCDNGTLTRYLEMNPEADRFALIQQIASAVSYLHNCQPVVIHRDLKGSNILIGDDGQALLTDFGLSNVIEEVLESEPSMRNSRFATSLFAGSTRWMAPELIEALTNDDEAQPPPISTSSDVYAFACVCLEVATGCLPFSHRSNDPAVIFDIMRGVKPSRGCTPMKLRLPEKEVDHFRKLLDRCWSPVPFLRPTMTQIKQELAAISVCCM